MLILTRRVGETLMIGDSVTVTVLGVKGNQVRIGITAPKDVAVHREEIFQRIGKDAANSARAALLLQALTAHPDLLLDGTREWLHQEARRESFAASMALVDDLREQGHAAVISGAGPSVLVLSTRERVGTVTVEGSGWQVLDPGVPDHGAEVAVLAG